MAKFFNYRDIDFKISGSNFFASSISLSASASVEPIVLSDGTLLGYAPQGAVVGSLSCDFYLTGALPSFLDVTIEDESPVQVSFAGVSLNKVYVKNISFSVEPFSPVLISAEFDWYGNVDFNNFQEQSKTNQQSKLPPSFIAHSYKSYMQKENFFTDGAGEDLSNIVSFSYSANCDRPAFFKVGESVPFRVAKLNKNLSINLSADNLGDIVNISGKNVSSVIFLKDFYGQSLSQFNIQGVMVNQNYSVSSGGYLLSEASIEQTITEQKVLV